MTNSTNANYRLVLHPAPAAFAPPSWEGIQKALQEAGFIGAAYGQAETRRFLVGDKFLQLLTFMGCSPYIRLEPEEEGALDFCHIGFSSIFPEIEFRAHERDVFARCPRCGRRDAQWVAVIESWRADPVHYRYSCPKCAAVVSPHTLNWRNSAGFARLYIDIFSIYPQEGVPTPQLLSVLERASGVSWRYFYTSR